MKLFVVIGSLCAVVGLMGCGGGNSEGSSSAVLAGTEGRPDVPIPEGPPPTKLIVDDLERGTGSPAEAGDRLSVRYFNFDYETHQVYEDRWSDAGQFIFTLGDGEALDAWETGLRGMRAGGRRELIVPKGYGSAAQVYVIELESVSSSKPAVRRGGGAVVEVEGTGAKPRIRIPPGPPPEELVVRELRPGSGKEVTVGEQLGVRFVGVDHKTKEVEDRWDEEPPYLFVLGQGDVRPGWEIGLRGMKLGARRELILPSRLAYGSGARTYVVELIAKQKLTARQSGLAE